MNLFAEIGPELTGIEKLRHMMEQNRLTGMEQTLGMRIVEVDDGRVVIEGTPGLQFYNPIGVVHGGYASTLLDNACGYAVLSKMTGGQFLSDSGQFKENLEKSLKTNCLLQGIEVLNV